MHRMAARFEPQHGSHSDQKILRAAKYLETARDNVQHWNGSDSKVLGKGSAR
jgi:hypothetical protein